eukprot:scaffold1239_cov175-Pinguiococcus_pyrenoidosus.AAC.12
MAADQLECLCPPEAPSSLHPCLSPASTRKVSRFGGSAIFTAFHAVPHRVEALLVELVVFRLKADRRRVATISGCNCRPILRQLYILESFLIAAIHP